MGLPRVSKEAYAALIRSIDEADEPDKDFALNSIEHLQKVNPVLIDFIYDFANKKMQHKRFTQCVLCMFLLYKLLENQTEVDELNAQFGD